MAITSLLPVVIFPWLGIMDTKKICENYLKVNCRLLIISNLYITLLAYLFVVTLNNFSLLKI